MFGTTHSLSQTTTMNYGRAVKIARAISGLQQKQLATRAQVDASHISRIEKGERRPSVTVLERISKALHIPNHLFMLLAAEPTDLDLQDSAALAEVGRSLTRLVISDGGASHRKKRRARRSG